MTSGIGGSSVTGATQTTAGKLEAGRSDRKHGSYPMLPPAVTHRNALLSRIACDTGEQDALTVDDNLNPGLKAPEWDQGRMNPSTTGYSFSHAKFQEVLPSVLRLPSVIAPSAPIAAFGENLWP